MPKTTVQQIIFGLLMSYFMAIGMEIYNTAINSGVTQLAGGFSALSYEVILDALKEASYMGIIVFIISELFGNRIGAGFMMRHTAQDDPPYFRQLMRTVAFMCPAMSLAASILFNVILAQRSFIDLPVIWIGTMLKNSRWHFSGTCSRPRRLPARYTMRCFSGAAGRSKAPADRPGCARSPHTARKR